MSKHDAFCYHFLNALDGATPIQTNLDLIEGKPFGTQNAFDKTGAFICIDCQSSDPISTYPELAGHIISSPPAYMGTTPENSSYAENLAIVSNVLWGEDYTV